MTIKAPDAHAEINLAGGSKSPPAKDLISSQMMFEKRIMLIWLALPIASAQLSDDVHPSNIARNEINLVDGSTSPTGNAFILDDD